MESIKEERENCASRSIFVSGIKKDTFVKQIEEYFAKFGKINKIIQDQEKVFLISCPFITKNILGV